MPAEIAIRHARPEDTGTFRALRLEALKNHPTVFGMDYAEAVAKEDAHWHDRLKMNPQEEALFFAEKDARIIGMTGIRRIVAAKAKHSATIWGVYVSPQWREYHVATSLIRACMAWAKERPDIVVLKLAVVTHNIPALRCYEQCGFTTYGVETKAIFYEGAYYDEYLMACEAF